MTALRTIGHGTLDARTLADLLDSANVEHLVDIRRFPGSRRHPQFSKDEMAKWLPEHGITYEWTVSLGGRRKPSTESPNTGLRNEQFRAYADYMGTAEFASAVDE